MSYMGGVLLLIGGICLSEFSPRRLAVEADTIAGGTPVPASSESHITKIVGVVGRPQPDESGTEGSSWLKEEIERSCLGTIFVRLSSIGLRQFQFKDKPQRVIRIENGTFMLDGEPLQIISGSAHYFRMPSEYWRDILRKQKYAGLNAVSIYVEWSFHEPEERQYQFKGDHDVEKYIRIAAEEGLFVLLRPGPYIDAERDLGGLPYWILGKYPNIALRSTDKDYIEETKTWLGKLFERLTPHLYGNGGPIILVQVENEYGSYYTDMVYKLLMRDIIRRHVTNKALLYTTDGDGSGYINDGLIPGALPTVDFPPGSHMPDSIQPLREVLPQGPLMNSEFYPGWFVWWGDDWSHTSTSNVVYFLRDLVDNKVNVNMLVFYGGTNFEFRSGADYDYDIYKPVITSYDFDAPLDEAGDPTPKYYAICKFLTVCINPPKPNSKGAYGKLKLEPKINLLAEEGRTQLGKKYSDVTGAVLPTFEKLRQRAGLMLYETTLSEARGTLDIQKPRDRIYVYLSGKFQGIIDWTSKTYNLTLKSESDSSVLSLLVENQGRIAYGHEIHDRKGILSEVKLNNKTLSGKWNVTGYPLEQVNQSSLLPVSPVPTSSGPVLYEGTLLIKQALDTYLNSSGWGKGYAWVNGYNLGRYWPGRGPQVSLYVPGVWLRTAPAHNLIQLLELERPADDLTINFTDHRIIH